MNKKRANGRITVIQKVAVSQGLTELGYIHQGVQGGPFGGDWSRALREVRAS